MEPIAFGRRLAVTTDVDELLAIAAEACAALTPEGIAVAAVQRPLDGSWHVRATGPSPEVATAWAQRVRRRVEKRPGGRGISAHWHQWTWADEGDRDGDPSSAAVHDAGLAESAAVSVLEAPLQDTGHAESAAVSVLEAEVDGGDGGSGLLALIRTQPGTNGSGGPGVTAAPLPALPFATDGGPPPAALLAAAPLSTDHGRLTGGKPAADLQSELAMVAALTGAALRTAHVATRLSQQERDQHEQQRYLSLAAHDLRTPLAAIRGYAQLLLRQRNVTLNPLQQTGLQTIIQQIDRLADQTEKMLDIARIQTRRMALRRATADVGQVVRQVVGTIQSRPGAPLIEVTAPESGPLIQADITRLAQIVQGLLEFAIARTESQHIDAQQPITVRVTADAGGVSLAVEEHGAPLTPDERDSLFRQLVAETPEGTSPSLAPVALYIVRGAAEAHGGHAWAESPLPESDIGLRLVVWLPLQHEA